MSVHLSGPCLPPSSSLPPIRRLISTSEEELTSALRKLQALYCPLRIPSSLSKPSVKREHIPVASTPIPADSGYASEDEDDDAPSEEEAKSQIVEDAAFILSSISGSSNDEGEEALTRDFTFSTSRGDSISITLNDAPLSGTDHTDVGLQSWGASIVLSSMICADPQRFNLASDSLPQQPTIIELGAGTGLVSLTLAKLLPEIGVERATFTATDYHSAVLENCKANVATNFPMTSGDQPPVDTMILDWSSPPSSLQSTADLLIASDVVYAPEHAVWLRDCAAHLLTPSGTFWLMVTVRKTGKFEGIPETVEAAFVPELCPKDGEGRVFGILERSCVEKRRGIGRGDETGYNLYRIGWA
ncbi:hypothetical protein N0V83_007745 [Neocucurbitaria cava]|uniref:S-adenosylmethionine-dependent methyltransferase n=1 Tax=Neocucurbitaria cava TaxID=798079 RepID=A0A9W8Y2C5_9PLEO|nr:hypothetical protein N0V83_007745 [Neocucurbitaria cava]